MRGPVLLVAPPLTKACEPDPAVLALAGFLRANGVAAQAVDANLAFQELLLAPDSLAQAFHTLQGWSVKTPAALTSAKRSATHGPRAWRALRDPATYQNPVAYRQALADLGEAFLSLRRAFGATVGPSDYVHPRLSPLSSADLALAAREPEALPGWESLDAVAEALLAQDPALIGVSASYLSQGLLSYALAGLLRRRGYRGLLLLGGGLVGSWGPRLTPASAALAPWDALVWGPGEATLLEVATHNKIPDAPGVLAPGAGVWRPLADGPRRTPVSFVPDVSSLPWERYLAPGGVLPVAASRGCYYARCAFCPEAGAARQPYRAAGARGLAELLVEARRERGLGWVHFTDNALSPAHLRQLSRLLRGRGLRWYGFARIEKALAEPGFLEGLAEGGCAMLQLGIESASPRLLERLKKGIDLGLADAILRRAGEAGIRVFGYFLFGSPTETPEEARRTLEWIGERSDLLTFLNLSILNLPRGGEIAASPEGFGVASLWEMDQRNDLSLYWGFAGEETVDRRRLRRILAEAKKDPALRAALARTPRGFTSNHAAFAPL